MKTNKEKGLDEAKKGQSKKKETDKQLVANMVSDSNQILITTSSLFPDIFPTTINVEATRVTIIHRQFFSSQVHSVDISDISNVFINMGFLFATLIIVSNTFGNNEIKITRLWKKEAIMVRRIIEGLRMFIHSNIDMTTFSSEELMGKLKKLSTTEIVV